MHLRSIALKGFKSFPHRTKLEFTPGVSVIVGPNGSGKSNITDAVLWALGEQSPLAVRGQTMKDVIFAGGHGVSGSRGAEVEVVIDQTAIDGWQSLGELDFDAGGDQWIYLGDATGEPLASMVQLAFDAVRITRVDLDGRPDPAGEPGDSDDDLDGGCRVSGGGGAGSLLLLLALTSSFVTRRRRRVAECNDPRLRQDPAILAT